MDRLPNIIYLHSHDTGRYIQPYGHAVDTPNLQRLANEGILFRQAFSAAPTCSPSRAALLTGQWPHVNGMLGLVHRGFSLNDNRQHLVHSLRQAGYYSALIGQQHVEMDPRQIGYDDVIDVDSNAAAHVAPAAVEFLDNAPDQPFFLTVGFFETHREFHPAEEGAAADAQPPPTLPDTPAIRRDMAEYKATARILDDGIGQLLTALDANDLTDNTLIIATTDHGLAMPGMKCNLTDHGIGVMLIMRGPQFSGGRVCDAMLSQIDLFPTLCELLDIEKPSWLQGRSFLPCVLADQAQINDAIFAEVSFHAAYEPMRAVRTMRYKYIRRFGDRMTPVLSNIDASAGKSEWVAAGWGDVILPREQLFDLTFDPQEQSNRADDPAYQTHLIDMRARLDEWMQATADPLLAGVVEPPAGARLNHPDALSPKEPTYAHPLH